MMNSASIRELAVTTFQQRSLKNKNVRSVDLPTRLDTQTDHQAANMKVRGDRRIQMTTLPPTGSATVPEACTEQFNTVADCASALPDSDSCFDCLKASSPADAASCSDFETKFCAAFPSCDCGSCDSEIIEYLNCDIDAASVEAVCQLGCVFDTLPPTGSHTHTFTSPPSGSTSPPSGSDTPAPTPNSFSPSPVTNPNPTPTPPSPSGGGSAAKYLAFSVVPLLIIGVVCVVYYIMRKNKKNHGPKNNEESGNSDFSLQQVSETPRNPQTGVSRSSYHHAHNHRNAKPGKNPPVTGSTLSGDESNHTPKTESASQEAVGGGLNGSRHNYPAPQFTIRRNPNPYASPPAPVPGPQGYTVSNKDQCRTVLAEEIMVTAVPIESDFDDDRNREQLDP